MAISRRTRWKIAVGVATPAVALAALLLNTQPPPTTEPQREALRKFGPSSKAYIAAINDYNTIMAARPLYSELKPKFNEIKKSFSEFDSDRHIFDDVIEDVLGKDRFHRVSFILTELVPNAVASLNSCSRTAQLFIERQHPNYGDGIYKNEVSKTRRGLFIVLARKTLSSCVVDVQTRQPIRLEDLADRLAACLGEVSELADALAASKDMSLGRRANDYLDAVENGCGPLRAYGMERSQGQVIQPLDNSMAQY